MGREFAPGVKSAMISRPDTCNVYCYLPGQTDSVLCGRFSHRMTGRDHIGRFVYGQSYLARTDAVSIDPITLPLGPGTFPPTARLGGVYGALRDAAPDAWGRMVIERARATTHELGELAYLLGAGDDRAGALAFGELTASSPAPGGQHGVVALPELLRAAEQLERAEGPPSPETQRAAQLLLDGVSMGGARPKTVVADEDALWLAKFPGRDDRYNMAAVEAGLLSLAGRCGMNVPVHRTVRVAGKPVLLVRRFDRAGNPSKPVRARFLSGLTLLDADELPSAAWSYLGLADAIRRRSSSPDADRVELFRRMTFNALVSNGDDHPRNHAIIAWEEDDWRLSPLFDVVPMVRHGSQERSLAMIAGNHGRVASRANLVSAAGRFRVAPAEADHLIDEMRATIDTEWESVMRQHGASATDLRTIRPAIVPEGFEAAIPSPVFLSPNMDA